MHVLVTFWVIVVAFLWQHKSRGYFELIEESGCHTTEFRLSCGSKNANIAIFEATFSRNDSFLEPLNTSCGNPGHPPNRNSWKSFRIKSWENYFHRKNNSNGIVEVNIRHALNRRCSGVNYCSFVLTDFEAASRLGPGAVYLRYACVNDVNLIRVCNTNIDASVEGFVKSPGYPGYYIGETTCLWTLRVRPPQKIRVEFLDVSLRGVAPFERSCLDWLIVSEDGLNLLSTCGDILEDTLISSDGSALNVSFKSSSKTIYPKRGFLFHYKAVGCPSLRKPQDGYLINRNETFAHYRCCVGFVFPDTFSRDKILRCYNENTWDGVLLDCVNVTELFEDSLEANQLFQGNLSAEARAVMEPSESLIDFVLPCVLMSLLFVGNGVVLYIIYRYRKKRRVHDFTLTDWLKFGRVVDLVFLIRIYRLWRLLLNCYAAKNNATEMEEFCSHTAQ